MQAPRMIADAGATHTTVNPRKLIWDLREDGVIAIVRHLLLLFPDLIVQAVVD